MAWIHPVILRAAAAGGQLWALCSVTSVPEPEQTRAYVVEQALQARVCLHALLQEHGMAVQETEVSSC